MYDYLPNECLFAKNKQNMNDRQKCMYWLNVDSVYSLHRIYRNSGDRADYFNISLIQYIKRNRLNEAAIFKSSIPIKTKDLRTNPSKLYMLSSFIYYSEHMTCVFKKWSLIKENHTKWFWCIKKIQW